MRHIARLSNTFNSWFGTFTMSMVIWERSPHLSLSISWPRHEVIFYQIFVVIQLLLCRLLTNEPCPEFRQKYCFIFIHFKHIIWTILPKMDSMKMVNNVAFLLKNTLLWILHSNEFIGQHDMWYTSAATNCKVIVVFKSISMFYVR